MEGVQLAAGRGGASCSGEEVQLAQARGQLTPGSGAAHPGGRVRLTLVGEGGSSLREGKGAAHPVAGNAAARG